MLPQKRVTKVEVIPNTAMFFKIITKDQLAPGKITFRYGEGMYVRQDSTKFNVKKKSVSPAKRQATVSPDNPKRQPLS